MITVILQLTVFLFQTQSKNRGAAQVYKNEKKVSEVNVDLYIATPWSGDTSTGWPKTVSHYRESSLNRIKNRQPG